MEGNGKGYVIITDAFGRNVRITKEKFNHILMTHPEMKKVGNKICDVLENPEYIKRSKYDNEVILYYNFTSIKKYITDRIKKGGTLWRKK